MVNKVAVVTGAGSGIGRAAALALCADGFDVVLAGRREGPLQETAALDSDTPDSAGEMVVASTDVSDSESVSALFTLVEDRFGRVDVLFNNAGMGAFASDVDELDVDTWRAVVDVNLTGSFLCAREAFRMMKTQVPQGGRIINNGSISAHAPRPKSVAYTSTKHAVTGLTKSLSLDGRPYNIACSQLDIGNAATDLTTTMADGIVQADGGVRPEPVFDVAHAGEAVRYMASLPLDTNVQFMTIMATNMPFVGRG